MYIQLVKIFHKRSDYRICPECGAINWHENDVCRDCESLIPIVQTAEELDEEITKVDDWVRAEYEFWEKEEGYTEKEADNVLCEV